MGFITRTYGSSMSEVKDKFDIKELIEFERFAGITHYGMK